MKKIILFLIPFLLTGCVNATYDLDIKRNLSVVESANISATKDYFDSFYMNLPITIVREAYENQDFISPLITNNYSYEIKKYNSPYPSVFVKKNFTSLKEYEKNTVFQNQKFEKINVNISKNIVNISTKNYIRYAPDDSDGTENSKVPISNLSINIKLPFVVTKSNADKVDKSTNTYTWKIDEKTENKEINITFDKNKIYIYNISWYISLVIIIILAIIATIYIIKTIKKNKKNNFVD